MKKLKLSKYAVYGLCLLVTAALFILGQHGHDTNTGIAAAFGGGVIKMSDSDMSQFSEPEKKNYAIR
jgi:hypothetical protein